MSRRSGFRLEANDEPVLTALGKRRRRGLQAVAIEVSGAAKRRTPVDTGRLRASIAWAVDGKEKSHSGTAGGTTVQYQVFAPKGTATVGTNVEYAPKVHEDLDAYHKTGEAKFLENAFNEKAAKAERLMQLALEGKL